VKKLSDILDVILKSSDDRKDKLPEGGRASSPSAKEFKEIERKRRTSNHLQSLTSYSV